MNLKLNKLFLHHRQERLLFYLTERRHLQHAQMDMEHRRRRLRLPAVTRDHTW